MSIKTARAAPTDLVSNEVSVVWDAAGAERAIRSWTPSEILKLKHSVTHEKDAEAGHVLNWQGPLLADFIREAMKELPLSQQAAVDLVIFRSRGGASVAIPRWLITKYPVLFGMPAGGHTEAAFRVVLPWTAKPGIRKEALPLNTYSLNDIVRVELASYDQVYSSFYLKKRSDPLAMKGEKLFVQNCTSCHATSEPTPTTGVPRAFTIADLVTNMRTRRLASEGHPLIPDAPRLSDREVRALMTYLDAFRSENSGAAPAAPATSAHNP